MADKVEVTVPPTDYRMDGYQAAAYIGMQKFIAAVLEQTNEDHRLKVFCALLSGVTRAMRSLFGPDKSAEMLRGYADTMHEAAKFDR